MSDYSDAKARLEQQRGDAARCHELEAGVAVTCDGCTLPAAYVVEIHNTDRCNEDDLTPDGNVVSFMCHRCLAAIARMTDDGLRHFKRQAPNVRRTCATCGRPLACMHDVLEVRPL
jgi:hypothetical protein